MYPKFSDTTFLKRKDVENIYQHDPDVERIKSLIESWQIRLYNYFLVSNKDKC